MLVKQNQGANNRDCPHLGPLPENDRPAPEPLDEKRINSHDCDRQQRHPIADKPGLSAGNNRKLHIVGFPDYRGESRLLAVRLVGEIERADNGRTRVKASWKRCGRSNCRW